MLFIDQLAKKILNDYPNRDELVVILPSERAVKYLGNALYKWNNGALIAPEMLTIDRWIRAQFSNIIDPTRLLIVLYECYIETKEGAGESFESFLTWGSTLLSDFNDLDRYLIDQDQIFKNLKSIKELESWQIDEENYSDSQLKFMAFWEQIPTLHTKLMDQLNKRSQLTLSQAYRKLAEETLTLIPSDKKYIFAGFNALSKAELQIIKNLKKRGDAEFIIDADVYYLDNDQHEAGSFLRDDLAFLEQKNANFIQDSIKHTPIDFTVIECSQHTGQIKVAATELAKLNQAELDETLVLLADETLIHSLVKNIPANVGKANITLGLPLQQTPVKSWVDLLFTIQENKKRFRTKALYFKDFQRILNHVFCLASLPDEEKKQLSSIEQDSIRKNKVFQLLDRMNVPPKAKELFELVTEDWDENWHTALDKIRRLNVLFVDSFAPIHEFERTAIQVFDQAMRGFESLLKEGIPDMEMRSFKLLLNQHWSTSTIAFHGNPTNGLQIMGLLESRVLDFENVIITSLNEGTLPSGKSALSFIPYDVKMELGLPTTKEKDAIYTYHFYHLLMRAKNVYLLYNTEPDGLDAGEKSRYLTQLLIEKKENHHTVDQIIAPEIPSFPHIPIEIPKTENVNLRLKEIAEKGFSPTGLTSYLRNPMLFYYQRVLRLGQVEEVEESIAMNTFGNVIHQSLEVLYRPYVGVYLSLDHTKEMKSRVEQVVHQQFSKEYSDGVIRGKNLIAYKVARQQVLNMLKLEEKWLNQSETNTVKIIALEQKFECKLQSSLLPYEVVLAGNIDRIEERNGVVRIIDYKTGKVDTRDLIVKDWNLLLDVKYEKAIQLLAYCLMTQETYATQKVETGIICFKNMAKEFMPLGIKTKEETIIDAAILEDYTQKIVELIAEILNPDIPFSEKAN